MASNKTNLVSKSVKNPLFSTGIANFPAEEFTQGVLLVPPPKDSEQLLAKGLGGEVDTFLGQDVTDLGPSHLPSSENDKSEQTATLLPPPPTILTSNFRAVPIRPSALRPVDPIQPLAESHADSEPDFKQIPLDDSVPLYNPSAVLKFPYRDNSQELTRSVPNLEGGVPLYDPSYVGSVLPPHATKRPLPTRPDNVFGPTPAALDPAYSSLSKHISTCNPSLVTDSGPPPTSVPLNTNISESRKSSSSSSVHELNAFNLQDQRVAATLSTSASSPSLHFLPQKGSNPLSQAYPSESLVSLYPPVSTQNAPLSHTGPNNYNNSTLHSASFYPTSHTNQIPPNSVPFQVFNQGPYVSPSGQPGPCIPPASLGPPSEYPINTSFHNATNTSNVDPNFVLNHPPSSELNTPPLAVTSVSNEPKSNETNSTLNFASSISDYSIPSFLNPLNLFKRGPSPSTKAEVNTNNPLPSGSFNLPQLTDTSVAGSESPNANGSIQSVAPSFQAPEPPSVTPTPLPPPPLSGFQISSTPLSSLPKKHHSLSVNPYSIHSQKKIPAPAFKPEHYFTPIPVSEVPHENIYQEHSQNLDPSSDSLAPQVSTNNPETVLNNSSNSLGPADPQPLNQTTETTNHLAAGILSSVSGSTFLPPDPPTLPTNSVTNNSQLHSQNAVDLSNSSTSSSLNSYPNPTATENSAYLTKTNTLGFPTVDLPKVGPLVSSLPPTATTVDPLRTSSQQGLNQVQSLVSPPNATSFGPPVSPSQHGLNQVQPLVSPPTVTSFVPPASPSQQGLNQIQSLVSPPPVTPLDHSTSPSQQGLNQVQPLVTTPPPATLFGLPTSPSQQNLNQVQSLVSPPTVNSFGPPTSTQTKNYRLGSLKRPVYAHVPDLGISSTSRPVLMTDNQSSVSNINQGFYQPQYSDAVITDQAQFQVPTAQQVVATNYQSQLNPPSAPHSDPIPSEQINSVSPKLYSPPLSNPASLTCNSNVLGTASKVDSSSVQAAPSNELLSSSSYFSNNTLPPPLTDYQKNLNFQNSAPSFKPVEANFLVSQMQSLHVDEIGQPVNPIGEIPFDQAQVSSSVALTPSMPVAQMQSDLGNSLGFSQDQNILPDSSHLPLTNLHSSSSYQSTVNNVPLSMPMESSGIQQQSIQSKSPSPAQSSSQTDGCSNSPFLTAHSSQQPFTVVAVSQTYRPVYHHWFYQRGDDKKNQWHPFSMADSLNLEQHFTSDAKSDGSKLVATDGGRYDVNVETRKRIAVFWHEKEGDVRRCSWFVKAPVDSKYQPYDENIAVLLEEEYKMACTRNEWNRKVELADGEVIIMHSPNVIAHHIRSSSPDPWGNSPPVADKQRVVKRGLDEFDIPEGEPTQVDHLLLLVHGIGKVCDLRFRSLVEVVDDFRNISVNLVGSHFKSAVERGKVGRVEVLPVEWHRALHTEDIDQRLNNITLPSIPKARQFTNETLLDILFYTSPVFCEKIVEALGAELNRVYSLYLKRNPGFRGEVSLGGHSLGSLILFDMLCHQKPPHPRLAAIPSVSFDEGDEDVTSLGCLKTRARLSRRMSYLTIGNSGAGQPYIAYPQLNFQPRSFFALGSPIGMFVTVRGIESLGEEFKFPTCPAFFNIFHPNDPVAYRMEGMINPEMAHHPAVLIPHHKGRKRMHLELKETMAHLTAAVKQKLLDSVKNTWNTVSSFTRFKLDQSALENQVDKVLEDEILCKERSDDSSSVSDSVEAENSELKVGVLNGGRRIDYVLQEAPLETFNQYISAVRSHLVYWESEDTMLLILKEIYGAKGVTADCQNHQPILPFDLTPEANADPGTAYSHFTVSSSPVPSRQGTIVEEPL